MNVKEFIEKLQKLDQERNIWVFYDYPCGCNEPSFTECNKEKAEMFSEEGCRVGDYVHFAG